MPTPSPRLAYTYRVLGDTALTAGLVALILAVVLPIAGTTSALPLVGTALIAGIIAIAATIQHRRYQQHPQEPAAPRDELPPGPGRSTSHQEPTR